MKVTHARKPFRRPYGNGYLIKDCRGSRKLYDHIWRLTEGTIDDTSRKERILRRKYHKFLVHVFFNMRLKYNYSEDFSEDIYVPIYSGLIRYKLRGIEVGVLEQADIIEYTGYHHYDETGKCREYRLKQKIFDEALNIEVQSTLEDLMALIAGKKLRRQVNLVNKRPKESVETHVMSTCHHQVKKYDLPDHIKQSLDCFQSCPINLHALIPWAQDVLAKKNRAKKECYIALKRLRRRFPELEDKQRKKDRLYINAEKEFKKALGLCSNVWLALNAIIGQRPERLEETYGKKPLFKYQAAYSPQNSGRLSEIHGSFQNLCTVGKELLLEGLIDKKVYNYDLKNSQAVILWYELQECGIGCSFLKKYIDGRLNKEDLADKLGITVGTWKGCFYSLVMGADDGQFGAAFDTIKAEVNNYGEAKRIHRKFLKIVAPLIWAIEKWHNVLLWSIEKQYTSKYRGYRWKNWNTMYFKGYTKKIVNGDLHIVHESKKFITKPQQIAALKRKLAAFFLQGRESYVIHQLAIACDKHGIPVYKNEHDGLLVGNQIPDDLFNRVARAAEMPDLKLERKPINSEWKRKKYRAFINS